jgi:hypothetical protein
MNTQLLLKIADTIAKRPKGLVMRHWHADATIGTCVRTPKCGTAHCIGGWAAILTGDNSRVTDNTPAVVRRYGKLLGLSPAQAERLFFLYEWPIQFSTSYGMESEGSPERAMIAVQRIQHFIKTDGRE